MWPSNARKMPDNSEWIEQSGETSMSLEMGLPREAQEPVPPLKQNAYHIFDRKG